MTPALGKRTQGKQPGGLARKRPQWVNDKEGQFELPELAFHELGLSQSKRQLTTKSVTCATANPSTLTLPGQATFSSATLESA